MSANKAVRKSPSTKKITQHAQPLLVDTKPHVRRLKVPPYKFFRFQRIKHPVRLPSVWVLSHKTLQLLWKHRWLFIGIAAIYGLLTFIFVTGVSSTDVNSIKQQASQAFGAKIGRVGVGLTVLSALATTNTSANASSGTYQLFLGLIISLAVIWALRQVTAGERVRVRDAFYKGMYPLVPLIVVLLVILLQMLPLIIGGGIYGLASSYSITVHAWEKVFLGSLFAVGAIGTIYMLCSSIFAVYIVTLPDMTPLHALRSARQLVRYRRGPVFRKLLFLVVALLVVAVVITLPVILIYPPLAPWLLVVLGVIGLVIVHAYIYTLYRELLT